MANFGIARTFQNLRVFRALTAWDNALIGQNINIKTNFVDNLFHTKRYKEEEEKASELVAQAIKTVGLEGSEREIVGSMPYGKQKRVELARALMCVSQSCCCLTSLQQA